MPKTKTPEQFIAQSPIGERLSNGVFDRHLAGGALRLIAINGEAQPLRKLGNNEAKVAEVLESGYFGILQSNPDFIEAEIADLLIDGKKVPDSYFQLQQRIARERGYGEIAFTEDAKDKAIVMLRANQAESLAEWADYLRSEENGHVYPDWFKAYAWESLKKMGDFDKEKGEFKKRTKSTTAPWPELNAEALAYVYDAIDTGVLQGVASGSDQLNKLLGTGNFAKLYAHAITEVGVGGSPELREITKGSWVKYDQIEGKYAPDYTVVDGEYTDDKFVDNPTVIALTDSLRGMSTGWCTAGTRTAAHQLSMGDFYVYYTQDEEGEDKIPRIAIRMENGVVAEVRGIEPDQEVEPAMLDIVAKKLKTLPGGDEYYKKVADMKWLTLLYDRHAKGEQFMLSAQELVKLYELEKPLQGFGWGSDPRVDEILRGRPLKDDLTTIFTDERYKVWAGHLDLRNLTTTEGLTLPEAVGGHLDLRNLTTTEGLTLPEAVGGYLNLGSLTTAEGLELPEAVGGYLNLDSLTTAEGLRLPETISGTLNLRNLTTAEGLELPEAIGDGVYLPRHLEGLITIRDGMRVYWM